MHNNQRVVFTGNITQFQKCESLDKFIPNTTPSYYYEILHLFLQITF